MLLIKYHSGDKIKKNEMDGACSTYGRQGFGVETLGKNHLEDLGIDGMLILKWILRKRRGDLEWIDVAHDRDRCACECGNEPSGSIM